MSENMLAGQSRSLVDTFINLLEKTGKQELAVNQLLAFLILSNTLGAINLIYSNTGQRNLLGSLDSLLGGEEGQGLQSALGGLLSQNGGKPNLMELVNLMGNAMGQTGGQGKLNPQMLMGLISMLSQNEGKRKPQDEEKNDNTPQKEDKKEKSGHEKR